jgi:hypothetical protein
MVESLDHEEVETAGWNLKLCTCISEGFDPSSSVVLIIRKWDGFLCLILYTYFIKLVR